jgi:hypothetical protein
MSKNCRILLGNFQPVYERRRGHSGHRFDFMRPFGATIDRAKASLTYSSIEGRAPGRRVSVSLREVLCVLNAFLAPPAPIGTRLALHYGAMAANGEPHAGLPAAEVPINEEIPMRKYISTLLAGIMLCGFGVGLTGCTDESAVKSEVKQTTPEGTTRETKEVKVDKSGQNPPLAPSEKK